ncbi:MAG TPA: Wadjet anti-phage system protein JetA family protein [Desulfitobacteriaceae bacterium]|nr:Wadjet anti-phage system protein JetA family protein [Desulfitobacteriaceae bacterium]
MRLFDIVPSELFSILSSPNRLIYSDALAVLYDAFRENLKIQKNTFFTMIRSRLEDELARSEFSEDGISEEEAQDLSGRARFLIRKLKERGWIELERGDDFEEYVILPDYSIKILELFSELTSENQSSGFSFVYETYSTLRMANEDPGGGVYEKMMALYGAYDKTLALIKMLKTVYHNINRYFQQQIDMRDVNQVLAMHFDDFLQHIVETYIRPLKIKDSVPKYKVPIQQVLDSWLEDDGLLNAMVNAALQEKRFDSLEKCRADIVSKLFFIKESYENFESEYLGEIDLKVRRYTRATTQKIESLSNNDQTIRGNLVYLLNALSDTSKAAELTDRIQPVFQIFEQSWICEGSLYSQRRPGKREKLDPVLISEESVDLSRKALDEFGAAINSHYSKKNVRAYMEKLLENADIAYTKDMHVENDMAYILSGLAVVAASDRDSFYRVEPVGDTVASDKYELPSVRFIRKKVR